MVWFTGLPSSGKTTLAQAVQAALTARGTACCLLDGDEIRAAVHPAAGYDATGREHQYATLADLAALLARQGLVVLVSATAHRRAFRDRARRAAPRFLEVLVDTPPAECERRDTKGLYARARAGAVTGVPGVDEAYERPVSADVTATGGQDAAAAVRVIDAVTGP